MTTLVAHPSAVRLFPKAVLRHGRLWFVCVAFAIAWLLPYHTYPFWSFYNDYVSVLGVVVALLFLVGARTCDAIHLPACALLPIGIAAWIVVQLVFGQLNYEVDAILPIGYLLAAAAAGVLGFAERSTDSRASSIAPVTGLALAILVAGCLSAVITFYQYLGIDLLLGDWSVAIGSDGKTAVRPYANLGQPNQLALLLCWSFAALWFAVQSRWLNAVGGYVLAVLLLTSLALTQSKIGWILVPVFAAWVLVANRRPWARRIAWPVTLSLVLWFVVVVALLPALAQWTGTPTESADQRMATNGVRAVMIMQGFFIGLQHPLTGVGWMGFPGEQIRVAGQFGETQFAMHSHNLIANLSAEFGWIATAAILGAIGYWLYTRFFRKPMDAAHVFVLMVFVAVGVHSMVEFPLWYAYVLLPLFFLAGHVESRHQGGARAWAMPRAVVVVIALVGAVAVALVASDYRRVVQGFRALGYERIGWTYSEGTTERPDWTMFPQFYDYFAFANVRPTVGMSNEQMAAFERVERRFGYAAVLMRVATIYALNGRPDDAVAMMISLQHLYRLRYGEAYRAWEVMSREYPEVLGKVYARLPPPVESLPAAPVKPRACERVQSPDIPPRFSSRRTTVMVIARSTAMHM